MVKINTPRASDSLIYFKLNWPVVFGRDAKKLIEAIAALANAHGGRIYLMRTGSNPGIPVERIEDYRVFWHKDLYPVLGNYLDNIPSLDFGEEYTNDSRYRFAVIYVKSFETSLISCRFTDGAETIFIRENGKNIKYSPRKLEQIPLKRIRHLLLMPEVGSVINKCNYQFINIEKPVDIAYKYMSLDSFIVSLVNHTWRFVEPKKWKDKYEGRFYNADYSKVLSGSSNPVRKTYATCITQSPASEAAWKVYSHGQGLGSRCIQLKLDMAELRKQLCQQLIVKGVNASKSSSVRGSLYEGKVYYELSDSQIDNLNKPGQDFYDTFFQSFSLSKFLKLLLLKRKAYSYEDEIRLFFVPDPSQRINSKKHDGDSIDIPVDWGKLIKEIKIDAACSVGELEAVKSACEASAIDLHIGKGRVAAGQIRLCKFDIDNMSGKRVICIG